MARHLFVFSLPCSPPVRAAHAFVLAVSEAAARAVLRRNCYEGAPVDAWPIVPMLGGAA